VVDLQGSPRAGLRIAATAGRNAWKVNLISNFNETDLETAWWVDMDSGIAAGTNQAAVRQTFKLTIDAGTRPLRAPPSATATGIVWVDTNAPVLLAPDYVVQFAQHSYNPSKDGAGQPATWHWSGFELNPSTPFSLIHTSPRSVTANNSLVSFASPAPANAFLRFSGVCKVKIDGNVAPKQKFAGRYGSASSYFVPIAQGKQSVSISFAADDWYGPGVGIGCYARDFSIWSKGGSSSVSTPTTVPPSPFPSPTTTPSPSPTIQPSPTATVAATSTPAPLPTSVPPTATATSTPSHTYTCLDNGAVVWSQSTPRMCP
jgi:cell division septation protein DedD